MAAAWNMTAAMAALILSCLITAVAALCMGIASRSGVASLGSIILGVVVFTAMAWIPAWTGTIIALVGAALFIQIVRKQY